MKMKNKTKIIVILLCLFLITGCATNNNKNIDMMTDNSRNINLGDCNCDGKTELEKIICEALCAVTNIISTFIGGGGTSQATPEPVACGAGYEGYEPNCTMKKISKVTLTAGPKYFTPGEATASFAFASVTPSDAIVKYSIASGSGFSISGSTVSFSNPAKGGGSGCAVNTVSVKGTNDVSSATSSSKSACVYGCDWSTGNGYWKKDGKNHYANHYGTAGCDFFDGGDGKNYYTAWHGRCCGGPPKSDYGFCYGDEPYRGIATKVKWVIGPETNVSGFPYRYDEIEDEEDCVLMASASSCKSGTTSTPAKEYSTSKCEDQISFTANISSNVCSSGKNNFYKIGCTTEVKTDFDMDDNVVNSNYLLYQGQGFKFNVGATEKTTCNASFYSDQWLSAYGKVKARLQTVKTKNGGTSYSDAWEAYKSYRSSNNPSIFEKYVNELRSRDTFTSETYRLIYEEANLATDIEQIVVDYNNFKVPDDMATNTKLGMSYALIGSSGKKTFNYDFDSEKEECTPIRKEGAKHTSVTKEAPWLKAPRNYTAIYSKLVNLYPKDTLLDKYTGAVVDSKNVNKNQVTVDGGNKIYFDNKTSPAKIPLSISVTGLARNGSSVKNDKCSIKIEERSILYRPVDLNNPFINSSWKKGENWENASYDFTKTIHSDTWSKSPLYTIDITTDMVNPIKESNKNNPGAYLGLCEKLEKSLQDSITRTICNKLK